MEKPFAASVEQFEQAVNARDYETACNALWAILRQLDHDFGGTEQIGCLYPLQLLEPTLSQERHVHFATRMAQAISQLFCDPAFTLSELNASRLFGCYRWIAQLFACSPYVNADHVLAIYHVGEHAMTESHIEIVPTREAFLKFALMYLPESRLRVDLSTLWAVAPDICASLCFGLQSSRFIGTPHAFDKRAEVLQWFPAHLSQLDNLDGIPSSVSHDVYMHCSYDIAPNKHQVKAALNQVVRRHLLGWGWQDRVTSSLGRVDGKPVMIVLLEHFHSSHSIYRTHSTSMRAAREQFYLVGLGKAAVDELGRSVFDTFHELSGDSIADMLWKVRGLCESYAPAVLYMPSIGMDLLPIFVSNTRLAPIQAVALGHPATTHSAFIDYVVVEDDYVGSEACFSEKLIRLPKDALPYVPSALAPQKVEYRWRDNPEIVQVGIAATTMKLNPYFLDALKAIRDRASVPVHFHFALGQSSGITHPYVERFIKSHLGDSATAHPHAPYHDYLRILHQCDMMLNPFPFGNTNGIIDMVTLGLVGVCKTGPEVHEHIDEGLFRRLGLPEWLIAETVDEYVERAVRLIENHAERLAIRRHIIENNGLQTLFSGDPSPMGKVFFEKVQAWERAQPAD